MAISIREKFPMRLRSLMTNEYECSPLNRAVSQKELGAAIGLSRQAISLYVNGETLPDIERFHSICAFFGVDYGFFLGYFDSIVNKEVEWLRDENRRLRLVETMFRAAVNDIIRDGEARL